MDADIRSKVIDYLRSLADEDLARLFYDAMEPRNDYRRHAEGDFWNDVYVIGIASHTDSDPAEIDILATALEQNEPFLDEVKHLGANNSGRCDICKTLVVSTSKIAKCPICGTQVECT